MSCRVKIAPVNLCARERPCPRGWIIQFRAGKGISRRRSCRPRPAPSHWAATSPCGTARPAFSAPVAVHVPVAGSYSSALARSGCCPVSPPRPAPSHWAATSPCETSARCSARRSPSTSPWPDHTAPRWQDSRRCRSPPRPAPSHWAATSPCEIRARCSSEPVAVHVPVAGSYSSALER